MTMTKRVLNGEILQADTPRDLATDLYEMAQERIIIALTKQEAIVLLAAPLPPGKLGDMIEGLRAGVAESLLDMVMED